MELYDCHTALWVGPSSARAVCRNSLVDLTKLDPPTGFSDVARAVPLHMDDASGAARLEQAA